MSGKNSSTTVLRPAQRGLASFATRHASHTVTYWMTWRHARLKLSEITDPRTPGWTVLQLELIAARDTPLPGTHTGFLQVGLETEELSMAGGAVAYMTTWLDREADTIGYKRTEARWRQTDLFDLMPPDEERT